MKKLPKRILKEIAALPDAVQDGEFLPAVGDRVIIRRDHRIEPITTLLRVVNITAGTERGTLVELHDEMLGQMFAFETKDAGRLTVKMLSLPNDAVPGEEVENDVSVDDEAH